MPPNIEIGSPRGSSPETDFLPDGDNPSGKKRKRKTFSCEACRKRKLRCDRTYPACSRCSKAGIAAACVYETVPENLNLTLTPARGVQVTEVNFARPHDLSTRYISPPLRPNYYPPNPQAERLAAIEDRLAQIDPDISGDHPTKRRAVNGSSALNSIKERPSTSNEEDIATSLYGKGFKTSFFGASSERGGVTYTPQILKLFPDFRVYLLDTNLQSPAFSQLRMDTMKIRKSSKIAKKLLPYPPIISLLDALPDKDQVTRGVEIYWQVIENTYRIYHAPTFWARFWNYWSDPSERTESFAATMLLMMSTVSCLDQPQPVKYRALSSVGREQASFWIEACESWINRQSRKHLNIESFQHRTLLFLTKEINRIKAKEVWERAQSLLNFAVATGLHQNPTKLDETYRRDHPNAIPQKPRTSAYEREMRRRLWATIIELEMQAAIDKGVPSSRFSLHADCERPSLIFDQQFDESSITLSAPEPRQSYTPVSYLHLSHDSVRLRAVLSEVVNSRSANYDEIVAFDDQIIQALDEFPEWVKARNTNSQASAATPSHVAAALLELQLLQFRLLLHLPFARRIENSSRYNLSRMTCIDAGDRILQLHLRLGASGNNILNLLREDVFRATMGICYNAIMWRGVKNDLSVQSMGNIYSERANAGLNLLEDKVLCLGEHYAQLWYISSAIGMLNSAFAPQGLKRDVEKVASRLTSLFAKVVAAQDEPSNEQTAAGALTALATPNSNVFDSTSMAMSDIDTSQPFMEGLDMSAWGFDDMWPFTSNGSSW